jgi:divalent metal cation (Fe/Co/Zn/Cd) transporter
VSLWGALREIRKDRGARSLWRWFRSTRQSELLVVLGEDLAALGGLALALAFIGLAQVTGDVRWDAAGSIAIGVLLVCVALLIAHEVKALLVGRSAEPELVDGIRAHLLAQREVAQVYGVLTQQLGADVMLAVKARMHPAGTDTALVEGINRVERALRERYPQIRWLFFEPDLRD